MAEENLEMELKTYLEFAEKFKDDLKRDIERCAFVSALVTQSFLYENITEGKKIALELREIDKKKGIEYYDKLVEIEEKAENIVHLAHKCEVKPKEPFKIVKEPPKD